MLKESEVVPQEKSVDAEIINTGTATTYAKRLKLRQLLPRFKSMRKVTSEAFQGAISGLFAFCPSHITKHKQINRKH